MGLLPKNGPRGCFFGIGAYAGFIQAGVGFFMIAALSLLAGIDLVRANAQKIFISIIFTFVALILFYASSKIHWGIGAILAAGQGIGGLAGRALGDPEGGKVDPNDPGGHSRPHGPETRRDISCFLVKRIDFHSPPFLADRKAGGGRKDDGI